MSMRDHLSRDELESYRRDGFLVLPGRFESEALEAAYAELEALVEQGVARGRATYPEPAKYTLDGRALEATAVANLVSHPHTMGAVESALGMAGYIATFVSYVYTPGTDSGYAPGTIHYDYRKWRPGASSVDWLFAIIPLVDFDDDCIPLWVARGSHERYRRCDPHRGVVHVTRGELDVDPQPTCIRAGDLALMSMFTGHQAVGRNRTRRSRIGLYVKFSATNATPGCGPPFFDPRVRDAFSPSTRGLIRYASEIPVSRTRALLEHDGRFLAMREVGAQRWTLPGGNARKEETYRHWDRSGNVIHSLEEHLTRMLGVSPTWMSYVDDFMEGPALCRVYAHPLDSEVVISPSCGHEIRWVDDPSTVDWSLGFEAAAIESFRRTDVRRGVGISQKRYAAVRDRPSLLAKNRHI